MPAAGAPAPARRPHLRQHARRARPLRVVLPGQERAQPLHQARHGAALPLETGGQGRQALGIGGLWQLRGNEVGEQRRPGRHGCSA